MRKGRYDLEYDNTRSFRERERSRERTRFFLIVLLFVASGLLAAFCTGVIK